jgi:protein TonB
MIASREMHNRAGMGATLIILFSAVLLYGANGQVHKPGDGVSAPRVMKRVDAQYTAEARERKIQGTVILYVEITEEANPENIRVVKPLGAGLDEAAIAAVRQWHFLPGEKDGKPVRVGVHVEVAFRLRRN